MKKLIIHEAHSFRDWSSHPGRPGLLPYGMEALARYGFELIHPEPTPPSRIVTALEYWSGVSIAAPVRVSRVAHRGAAILSLFEDPAVLLGLLRKRGALKAPVFVITCWLAQRALHYHEPLHRLYRSTLPYVDGVFVFSANQKPILVNRLGLDPERIHVVPFGSSRDFYQAVRPTDGDYLLAAGSDSGRDYSSLVTAAAQLGIPVKIIATPRNLAGITLPANVEYLGHVDHLQYRELLAAARVVAVPVHPFAYPSGQSVLVEAMLCGKPIVTARTAALRDYAHEGVAALYPHGEPGELATALSRLWDAGTERLTTGLAARAAADEQFTSEAMWEKVALTIIREARLDS